MVIFQTSREGSALFSDVVPVPRAVEFKMATGCKFLSLAASIFRTLKDQNTSKFKEKIQHYQFNLTFYGICTSCFIFQLSI